jgi:hypothetical protein
VPIDYLPSPEVDSISPSIGSVSSPSSGWNNNHRYQTRFKQHHSANIAAIDFDNTSFDTPFDESLYNAFIAIQDSYPI